MRQLNCIVPIRVHITGTLDDEQAVTLQDSVAAAVEDRLLFAQRTLAERMHAVLLPRFHRPTLQLPTTLSQDLQAKLSNLIESAVASATTGRSATSVPDIVLASYPSPSRPALRRPAQAAWVVESVRDFRIRVSDFLSVIREFAAAGGEPSEVSFEILYADLLTSIRIASVLVIAVNRVIEVDTLVDQIAERVSRALPSGAYFLYGYTVSERFRHRLMNAEQGGVLTALPDLSSNRLGVTLGGQPYLTAHSKLLFALMRLPSVSLGEATYQYSEIGVPLTLRDVDFLINPDSFERLFDAAWNDFLNEYGNTPAILRIQPFGTARVIHQDTLRYLMNAEILGRFNSDTAVFGRLQLLNRAGVQSLPAPARAPVTAILDENQLNLADVRPTGLWEGGWTGGYVYTAITPTADQLNTARYAPEARANAPRVIDFLTRSRAYPWSWEFLHYLSRHYQTQSRRERGSRTMAFEFLLRELESRENGRWFREFYDAVEGAYNGDLVTFVMQMSLATAHANHIRVVEMIRRVNANRRSYLQHGYDVDAKEVLIYHDPHRRLRVGMLVSALDPWFTLKRDVQRIKPGRLEELKRAVAEEGRARFERILKGEDPRAYNEETFGQEVLAAALQKIHITNDDLEEITVSRTLRFLDLRTEIENGIERYYITYEYLERIDDEPWTTVEGSRRTVPDSDFEFLLWAWVYNHEAAIIQGFAIGVSVLSVLVVAWEVGAIAALIDLAGGALNVAISVGISELIYLATAEHYTLRGFLLAALDGYLFAVGFRFGGIAGRAIAGQIGTQSIRRVVLGWIAERATVGIVGGATSGALTTFANGLIDVATGHGGFPTFSDFVRNMELGALMGVVFEFAGGALQPLARAVGRTGIDTLANLARSIREEGVSLTRWAAATEEALGNIRQWVSSFMEEAKALGVGRAFEERVSQVTEAMRDLRQAAIFRRVLELADIPINRATNSVLDKLLSATEGHISDESLLGLFNRLRTAGRLPRFMEMLNLLDENSVNWLAEGNRLEAFANATNLQDLIGLRGAETVLRMVNTAFRGSVANAEGFLQRIARRGDHVRATAVDALQRPNQRITPQALETVASRFGGLSAESIGALDRLYATAVPAAADGFLARIAPEEMPRILRFLNALDRGFTGVSAAPLGEQGLQGIRKLLTLAAPDLGETALAEILNQTRHDAERLQRFLTAVQALPDDAVSGLARAGELANLANDRNLLQIAETRGAGVMWKLVSGPFAGSPANAEAWLAGLHGQPGAVQNRAIDLIRDPGRVFTPEGLLQAVTKAGAIPNDYVAALNDLYRARGAAAADAMLTAATENQISLRAAQTAIPAGAADLSAIEAKLLGTGNLRDMNIVNEVARLQSTGRVANLEDWARGTAPNSADQIPHFVSELAAARDLAATAGPGRVVRVGQDVGGTGRSFDVTQEVPGTAGPVIERRSELFTPATPIRRGADFMSGVAHAVSKIPPGPRPPGTFEAGVRVEWPPPTVPLGTNERIFFPDGRFETREIGTGRLFTRGHLADQFLAELNDAGRAPLGKQDLNFVTIYNQEGNVVMQFENRTPGAGSHWVRIR